MDDQVWEQGSNWYSGVEPIEVGNMDDVKEERQVVPPTKGVKIHIAKAENTVNKTGTWRGIKLTARLVDGINAEGKFKNKPIFSTVTYYADPNTYTKDFFKSKQHLVQLKYLKNAIGYDKAVIDGHFIDELINKEVLADITIRSRAVMVDDGKGGKVEEKFQDNELRNFKALPLDQQI